MIAHPEPSFDLPPDPASAGWEPVPSAPQAQDWTPFHEVEASLDRLATQVLVRWRPRNARTQEPPVADLLQDALLDLRPLVREACAVWRRLRLYLPADQDQGRGR